MPSPKPFSRNRIDLNRHSACRLDRILPYLWREHPEVTTMTRAAALRIGLFELINRIEKEFDLGPIDLPFEEV